MDPHDGKEFPKGVLYAAGALVLFSLTVAFVGRATGIGTQSLPVADAVQVFEVRFVDHGAEGLEMRSARSGELLSVLRTGEDGFIRGLLRSMNRTRKLEGQAQDAPFQFTRWSDGRVSVHDPSTDDTIQVMGFGATHSHTIQRLMASAAR